MSEQPAVSFPSPEEELRHCPECGARVAERATTCLMCGTSLAEERETEEPAPRERPRWPFWVVAGGVSLLILAIAGVLLRPLVLGPAPTPTLTASPTVTPTTAATSTPTVTPTVTPTPTPLPPRAHQVQDGETLLSIAEQYNTTTEEILALNPGITPELLQVGQVLLIPPAVPTPVATLELEGTLPPSGVHIHVVAPGETLLSIAQRYGVTVALIRAANPEIPPGSDVIRVNQTLIIPLGTPMPTPTPTLDLAATPTPVPLYSPPPLLGPADGTVFDGPNAVIVLHWASVAILRADEWYEVRVDGPGVEPTVVRMRATAYRVPGELYPPPEAFSREFRWRVRVVRQVRGTGTFEQASEPEPVRTFVWLETLPTPTMTPIASPTP